MTPTALSVAIDTHIKRLPETGDGTCRDCDTDVERCRVCGVLFCGCDRYQPEIAWETELCRKCLPPVILQWARLRRIGFEIEEETIA